jgi:hypothetical protein
MQCTVCGSAATNLTPGDFDGLVVPRPHVVRREGVGSNIS